MKLNIPLARKDSLVIKELPDETLVYDMKRDKAHCLNSTAALVWKNCDGKRTITQLREALERYVGSPVPIEIVWLALGQLENFQLLDDTPLKHFHLGGLSRRKFGETNWFCSACFAGNLFNYGAASPGAGHIEAAWYLLSKPKRMPDGLLYAE